jgi:hypothetical protein
MSCLIYAFRGYFETAKEREQKLKEELAHSEAKVKHLQKQIFGKKTEKGKKKSESLSSLNQEGEVERKRGQQPKYPPPKRREHPDVPVHPEIIDLGEDEKNCEECGLPAQPFFKDEVTEIKEIVVKAHIRKIIRKCYVPGCQCKHRSGVLTGMIVGALFHGSQLGVSIWMEILLAKYRYGEPINRLLNRWDDLGLSLAPRTCLNWPRQIMSFHKMPIASFS